MILLSVAFCTVTALKGAVSFNFVKVKDPSFFIAKLLIDRAIKLKLRIINDAYIRCKVKRKTSVAKQSYIGIFTHVNTIFDQFFSSSISTQVIGFYSGVHNTGIRLRRDSLVVTCVDMIQT